MADPDHPEPTSARAARQQRTLAELLDKVRQDGDAPYRFHRWVNPRTCTGPEYYPARVCSGLAEFSRPGAYRSEFSLQRTLRELRARLQALERCDLLPERVRLLALLRARARAGRSGSETP